MLLDINLPDGNGIDVLKWARSSFPEMMFIMITARGRVKDAVDAMRSGAHDYLEKPIDMESLVEHVNRVREMVELKRELSRLSQAGATERASINAESSPMIEAVRLARAAAESGAQTILLLGESGCGKDLMARFIHEHSHRANKPFMVINCAAVPETLLESELFGYEKGAFTDAKNQKRGTIELANEGTVFLDEIGEMKPSMQSKLLRVLEDWTYQTRWRNTRHYGGCACDRRHQSRPGEMVNAKEFREDLYYRFNVFPIQIPPLRKRPEDIAALAQHFLTIYNAKFGKKILGFTKEAMNSLASYPWPGNVRELRNVIERAMILQAEPQISSLDFLLKKNGALRRICCRGFSRCGSRANPDPARARDHPWQRRPCGASAACIPRQAPLQNQEAPTPRLISSVILKPCRSSHTRFSAAKRAVSCQDGRMALN